MKKILTIIFIFASLFASSQGLMNKNFEGFRVKVSELVIDGDTMNISETGGIEANSIDVDTVKIDGVPLLLNTFKKDSLGGAGTIPYSNGVSSQLGWGTINQVAGGGLLTDKYLTRWDGSKFVNSGVKYDAQDGWKPIRYTTDAPFVVGGGILSGGTGVFFGTNVNLVNNKQLWVGDVDYLGNASSSFIRFGSSNGVSLIDAISGDNVEHKDVNIAPISGNVVMGQLATSVAKLHIVSTGEQARFNYNNSIYSKLYTNNLGVFQIEPTGKKLDVNGDLIADVLKSRVPTGTAPLQVASTTKVDNLNADMVDGKHQSDFLKYTDSVITADTIKARADIIVTGEIYDEINHLYGMVYDSTITLSLTQNVWQQVTNPTKTLYSTAEQDGVTISGDTIVFSKAGGYDVYFEINCTGIDSKDYHYRILQKNGTTTVRSYNKYASTGTQVLRNEKAYVHVAAGSKVWCEIMSPSSAPGNVTIQGAKIYAMQRYLEK